MIENAEDQVVHQSFNGLRSMIKTRTRRNDMRARARQAQHVFQVNVVKGGFAHHQDQFTTFFQYDISRPMN